ncbi:chemotaxis protein CheA [Rickettsiales bacterium]|nr:chemotaxis protein CheA [Rickettsiales bacterium]
MNDMQQFKDTYITECYELLEDMESKLLGIDESNPDLEDLNAIFRCAHSIKGGAGAFSLDRIAHFTHILEGLLDSMREFKIPTTHDNIDILLSSADILKQMVAAAQAGTEATPGIEDNVVEQLNAVAGNENTSSDDTASSSAESNNDEDEISIFDIAFTPYENIFLSGNEPLLILRELESLGTCMVYVDSSKIPTLDKLKADSCYLKWNITLETEKSADDVKEVFEFVEDDCDVSIDKIAGFSKGPSEQSDVPQEQPQALAQEEKSTQKTPPPTPPAANEEHASAPAVSSIRVDIDKVDRLVNLVGELVITQAMIASQASSLQTEEFIDLLNGIEELGQHTVGLQEAVMSVRMQPVKSVFSRMPRLVRDLSKQLNKDIKLDMIGENTELDKTVIEQLSDPLTHMIRNSVDHGIENNVQDRIDAGKPAQGSITLEACHRGGKIVIEISDDGAGLNRDKLIQKARDKGLISPDATLSDEEADNLIFMPGFSTANVVSDISGRGVGMDVVRRNIEGLGGSVVVYSKFGVGTTFEVTLPLTLAILDGMIVRVGKELYIIPIGNIVETLRPTATDINKIANKNDTINVRGEFVSVLYLHNLFNVNGAIEDASNALIVLVENGNDKFGLVVDELVGQQQVVIKSLEENSNSIPGISAATILGDGKVSLILDILGLWNMGKKYRAEYKDTAVENCV